MLNWGVGHATRSLPVVNELLKHGYEVVVCSDGEPLNWLRNELSGVIFEELPSYQISYTSSVIPWYFRTLPSLAKAIKAENRFLEVLVEKYSADFVISDNRLGFYSQKKPSYYITHQLSVKVAGFSTIASRIHAHFINKYSEVWIPDSPEINLSGKLSVNKKVTVKHRYLGTLSRYSNFSKGNNEFVLGILTGPVEVRRNLLGLLQSQNIENLVIVGAPDDKIHKENQVFGLVSKSELEPLLQRSKMIISRCGYSTLMDLLQLKVPALLLPTPGQFEQEYLASIHKKSKYWVIQTENEFNYNKAVEQLKGYSAPEETKNGLQGLLSFLNGEAKG